jgi:hypothetical protein
MIPNDVISWDEDRTKFRERLVLHAATYHPDRMFDVPASLDWRDGIASPGGNYGY